MDLGLNGKVALVGGSSSGLGRALAVELAREGACLILCSRFQNRLQPALEEVLAAGAPDACAIAADLSRPADIEGLVSSALERFGRVDILVNNSGGPPAERFQDLRPEQWKDAIDLVLGSVINLTRLILPQMKERGWGRILNITSVSVKQPVEKLMLSNSLRAAVTGFSRTLADEVAACNVTVNCILPGYTRTERLEELAAQTAGQSEASRRRLFQAWTEQIPMKRLGEPHEFAALATFLVSERASYITGVSIPVDGGWTRSLF